MSCIRNMNKTQYNDECGSTQRCYVIEKLMFAISPGFKSSILLMWKSPRSFAKLELFMVKLPSALVLFMSSCT